ncbi:outer membrane lipoprotein-sorting protein [Pseudomonas sp. 22105]|jgi:outer membrane lipoprotein-sorting protein|uniref:Outer membrane lipoprotein-sorting protein n=1 Tax=Pseudomonas glycinae TaxID=1785145 RepID=A0ABN4MVZ5_9PSED|nr:outer membrane lipoprotein-sorting protein [Pseudomonas glycinae]AMQ85550.1 outer membrane lipoprotein-sorting protein [Pseudomonas glycinae]AWA37741.1 outer membrane lipoprotein-sorting protein [Pseudomonas fluorescens]NKF26038.1 outer membrane lipoprotein-sorting protein [Pseudomonas sp. BG5]
MLPLLKSLTATALILSGVCASAADGSNADEIIRQVRDRNDGKSFMSQVSLILHDKKGNTRVREFTYLQKDYPDSDKFSMYFSAPTDVRDVAFHIENPHETLGLEDSQWMYLPVSRQTRRISTTDKRGSFMGSEYSYADLDKIRVKDYSQTLLGEEQIKGRDCYVIEREPVSPEVLAKTGYNKLKVWIDKQNFLVMRQDFFDVKGVLIKQMRTQKVETIDGIDSIQLSETEHFIDGTRSEMRFNQLQYNVPLEDRLFTQTAIKRGLKTGDLPEFSVTAR